MKLKKPVKKRQKTRKMPEFAPDASEISKQGLEAFTWEALKPLFEELQQREVATFSELKQWLKDRSELSASVSEHFGWLYIRSAQETDNKERAEAYRNFVTKVLPQLMPADNALDNKLFSISFIDQLSEQHSIMIRAVRGRKALYREENVPLTTEITELAQRYGQIIGSLSIEHKGETITLQKANGLLKETDRALREEVYVKIVAAKATKCQELSGLYDQMIRLRSQIAENAGFENFRDFKFKDLGRYDYSVDDCLQFHESIEKFILPLVEADDNERKRLLGLNNLRPWDGAVDPYGDKPLKVFDGSGKDLLEKTLLVMDAADPFFGQCLRTMNEMGHLDLESRTGKAPGGFNYPLYHSGVPFIFMNAVGTLRDFVTLIHEGGHAVHSFLSNNLELMEFKRLPSEIAELASMGMELITMEHWHLAIPKEDELRRAKKEHLGKVIEILPWISTIDTFQHEVYSKKISEGQQKELWLEVSERFSTGMTDWRGYEEQRAHQWQGQLHLFEVPFYYIEYGFAQLGALALWRNYKSNPSQTLAQFKGALSLGYTVSIPELYKTAGIAFDFSPEYIRELAAFVQEELSKL